MNNKAYLMTLLCVIVSLFQGCQLIDGPISLIDDGDSSSIVGLENVDFQLICQSDLVGFNTDGAIFEVFLYRVSSEIESFFPTSEHPDYGEFLDPNRILLPDIPYELPWAPAEGSFNGSHVPLNHLLNNVNLTNSQCFRSFKGLETEYTSSQFCSYYSGYPMGFLVLILDVKRKELVVVYKRM